MKNPLVRIVDKSIVEVHAFKDLAYLLFGLEPVRMVDAGDFCLGWGEDDAFDPHVGAFDIFACLFDVGQVVGEDGDLVAFA